MLRVSKWVGLVLTVLLAALFLISINNGIHWQSPSCHYGVGTMHGVLSISWPAGEWRAQDQRYQMQSGWSFGMAGLLNHIRWWPRTYANKLWKGLELPLWMPFLAIAFPTGCLWYRDRQRSRAFWRRVATWLCPNRPLRVRASLVFICFVAHGLGVLLTGVAVFPLASFLFPWEPGHVNPGVLIVSAWGYGLLLPTPLWAVVWAFGLVGLRNRIFQRLRPDHCSQCGYDLRGSVSDRCSECGASITSMHAGDAPNKRS